MLSEPVQLIAWKDRPRNDLLCVEGDVKHLLTHSLILHPTFWATVCKTVRPMLSDHCPVCPVLSVCNVGVLWPNGWMDQDETWCGGIGLGPGHIVLDGDPAPPKGAQRPQFSAHVCCGQTLDGSRCRDGGRPRLRRPCVAPSPRADRANMKRV